MQLHLYDTLTRCAFYELQARPHNAKGSDPFFYTRARHDIGLSLRWITEKIFICEQPAALSWRRILSAMPIFLQENPLVAAYFFYFQALSMAVGNRWHVLECPRTFHKS